MSGRVSEKGVLTQGSSKWHGHVGEQLTGMCSSALKMRVSFDSAAPGLEN